MAVPEDHLLIFFQEKQEIAEYAVIDCFLKEKRCKKPLKINGDNIIGINFAACLFKASFYSDFVLFLLFYGRSLREVLSPGEGDRLDSVNTQNSKGAKIPEETRGFLAHGQNSGKNFPIPSGWEDQGELE